MANPFNEVLDWAVRGKLVRVTGINGQQFEGWLNRVHHQKNSVVIHSATDLDSGEKAGSVYLRQVDEIRVLKPRKAVKYVDLTSLQRNPLHDGDFEPKPRIMRMAYRDRFTGSFPVVRRGDYTIINGHKRVAAALAVGLRWHPVELVEVTDEEARELFYLAHNGMRKQETSEKIVGAEFEWNGEDRNAVLEESA